MERAIGESSARPGRKVRACCASFLTPQRGAEIYALAALAHEVQILVATHRTHVGQLPALLVCPNFFARPSGAPLGPAVMRTGKRGEEEH